MADRPDHDLATELERSQNSYIAKMSDGHNSIIVRSKDDELAECYRLMGAAAARLRQLTERLGDSWYTDIGQRLDDVTDERDRWQEEARQYAENADYWRDRLNDHRASLAVQAFTAPDEDEDVMMGSLVARISDCIAERDAERAARERAEAEARQLRELTEGDPYSIYHEAAEMRSELMHLRRWKLEAAEVIESWERVYEALGDVGGLGQRRSDAVLAEVLRMKAELDRAQLRSIEASNPGIDMDEVRRVRLAYPDPERHETVSRAKYGASLASDIAADGGAAVAEAAEDRGQTDG